MGAAARCGLVLVALRLAALPEARPATQHLVVAPADGSSVLAAEGAAVADVTLTLDREHETICVTTHLEGRAPAPEACLSGATSIHMSNVPLGRCCGV